MKTTRNGMSWMGLIGGLILFGATACTGEFHSNKNLREMQCDHTGCWHCEDGFCEEYRCDETHQCPMRTVCSIDRRCLPGDDRNQTPSTGCTSHSDCGELEVCTLDGACVPSPGLGQDVTDGDANEGDANEGDANEGDTNEGDTNEGDASEGDVGPDVGDGNETPLPQHPDEYCATSMDCGLHGTCINGDCFFDCRVDETCPPGQECTAYGCRPRTVAENACTFNGECGTNHSCREGTCYRRCDDTPDCRENERCSGGLCVADVLPVIQCSGPSNCDPGLSCVDGKCVSPCAGTNECNTANQTCDVGFCMPAPTCFDADDCGGADCVDGICSGG